MKRRRFISIAGLASLGALGGYTLFTRSTTDNQPVPWVWRGVLFGADVTLQLYGIEDEARADALTRQCFNEMRRLEMLFSLFEPGSSISVLNRHGHLDAPHQDFCDLLQRAISLADLTDGAFDPTIQSLWLALNNNDSESTLRAALSNVDYQSVAIDGNTVRFRKAGTQITLNGIAQGYITDRVTELLRSEGIHSALVNMGEYQAIGQHPEQRPWEIGIRGQVEGEIADALPLSAGKSLAVSGGHSYPFESGGMHHLLHPQTGACQPTGRTIAVVANDATTADAISTACAVVDDATARNLAQRAQCSLRIYEASGI